MRFPARGRRPRALTPGQVLLCFRAVVGRHTAVVNLMHARTSPSIWYVALRTTAAHASTHTHASHGCHKSWGTKCENRQPCPLRPAQDVQEGVWLLRRLTGPLFSAAQLLGTFQICMRWKAQHIPSRQCEAYGRPPSVKSILSRRRVWTLPARGGAGCEWVTSGMTPGRDRRALP